MHSSTDMKQPLRHQKSHMRMVLSREETVLTFAQVLAKLPLSSESLSVQNESAQMAWASGSQVEPSPPLWKPL